MEKLNLFFAQIKDLNWWQRLFRWRKIRNLSFDAYEEFRALSREMENNRENIEKLRNHVTEISTRNDSINQKIRDIELLSARKDAQVEELKRQDTGSTREPLMS